MTIALSILYILIYGALWGGIGFEVGFNGPIIVAQITGQNSAQGPLLGIFVTGPLGLKIGWVLGFIVIIARKSIPGFKEPVYFILKKKTYLFLFFSIIIYAFIASGFGFSLGFLGIVPTQETEAIVRYALTFLLYKSYMLGVFGGIIVGIVKKYSSNFKDPIVALYDIL